MSLVSVPSISNPFNLSSVRRLTCLDAVLGDIFHSLQQPVLWLSRLPQLQIQQLSQLLRLLPLTDLREEKLHSVPYRLT